MSTLEWPHSAHGRLVWFDGGSPVLASGVLIGSRHVLTAAHNVEGANLKTMRFNRAQNGGDLDGGSYEVRDIALPKPWREHRDTNWDLAVLLLDESPAAKFYAVASAPAQALAHKEVALTGYPWEADGEMWLHSGAIEKVTQEVLCYSFDTQIGESGGALYLRGPGGRPTVVGIHRFRDSSGCEGVRITPDKFSFIKKCLS